MIDATPGSLTVALITDLFPDQSQAHRLSTCLSAARAANASLAVLPEIPLNPWSPATPVARDQDAESPGGWRARLLSKMAVKHDIAILGGVIQRDPVTRVRYNTALLFDNSGAVAAQYEKLHLPEETGFWETSHYAVGRYAPRVAEILGTRLGVQICSDANRPVGAQILAAQGVEVILAPRATEVANYARWRLAYQAMALTASAFVVSVNRPGPEAGVEIGGPSLVVDPDGTVVVETEESVAVVTLGLRQAASAKCAYPGYVAFPAAVYADAWQELNHLKV